MNVGIIVQINSSLMLCVICFLSQVDLGLFSFTTDDKENPNSTNPISNK